MSTTDIIEKTEGADEVTKTRKRTIKPIKRIIPNEKAKILGTFFGLANLFHKAPILIRLPPFLLNE